MKWYSIQATKGGLFEEDSLIQAKNSKEALETLIKQKVKRVIANKEYFDYSVYLSDEKGRYSRDRRNNTYYKLI